MKKILLSRTDNIGDVMLSLPMAAAIKAHWPQVHICFLGKAYTRALVEACAAIDSFLDWDELMLLPERQAAEQLRALAFDALVHVFPVKRIARLGKLAGIALRIGTSHRLFHWRYCNKRLALGRRQSDLHEAQLNLKLLVALGLPSEYSLEEIASLYRFSPQVALPQSIVQELDPGRRLVLLHPKSKGSAREWPLAKFAQLIEALEAQGEGFQIAITGTAQEGALMRKFLDAQRGRVLDLCGKLSLAELIALIAQSQALVAASTGVLHIAAALGVQALGLYAPIRPLFAQRWGALGERAENFSAGERSCRLCKKGGNCPCIERIEVQQLAEALSTAKP